MPGSSNVVNVVVAGLGGQGVLKASDILASVAFRAGLDVKKSEIHGMSQRGGSVSSDVRFGPRVFSPMVPEGEADFLVVIASDQIPVNEAALRQGGVPCAQSTAASSLDELLAFHSGQTVERVAKDTDRDFIMSAIDAADYGLVDEVITNRELAAVPSAESTN